MCAMCVYFMRSAVVIRGSQAKEVFKISFLVSVGAFSFSKIAIVVLKTVSGIQRDAVDPLLDEELRELRIIARRLAADADLAAFRRRAVRITFAIIFFTAGFRSSKTCATISESRSTPRISCVRSFEPIEKPSKISANSLGQDHVARDLAHDVDLETVLAAA